MVLTGTLDGTAQLHSMDGLRKKKGRNLMMLKQTAFGFDS